jgi:hypothetical protein
MACSLDAAGMEKRLEAMTELGRKSLLGTLLEGGHAELRFSAGEGVPSALEAIVAAEAECCPFLALQLSDEGDDVRLTIDAPAGGEPILLEMISAFGAEK